LSFSPSGSVWSWPLMMIVAIGVPSRDSAGSASAGFQDDFAEVAQE
jgi:hypothetical protein